MTLFRGDMPSIVLDDRAAGLRIVADRRPSARLLDLLSRHRYGSAGLEYRRLDVEQQLERLPSPVFVSLELDGRLVGSYVLATTAVASAAGEMTGIYRGLLGIDPRVQSRGLGRTLAAATIDWIDASARRSAAPVISWGCIEAANHRSLGLLRSLGADRVGELESLTVFRQWPRRRIAVDVLDAADAASVRPALEETYADCALRPAGELSGTYRAVCDDDGVVAGARATLTRVDMSRTGSAWDTAWQALLRFVPPARRRFDPRNFTYLRLSDVVVRRGREDVWRDLLPTLLAEHDAYLAMFMLAPSSRARERLGRARLFGRLTASTRQRVAVLAHAWGLPEDLDATLGNSPVAIGPLDI